MQNFIENASESKGKLLVGLGGAAIVGLFGYLYKQYQKQPKEQPVAQQEVKPPVDPIIGLKQKIAKFKATINITNPSLEEIKKIIIFSLNTTYKEVGKIHNDFKVSRRILKSKGNLKQYFNTVRSEQLRLGKIGKKLQQDILKEIGVAPQILNQYKKILPGFIQEQRSKLSHELEKIPFDVMKTKLNDQLNLLKEHGDQLVSNIVQFCKDWEIQAKKQIPKVFIIYMSDELAARNQQADNYDISGAEKRFEKQLANEIAMINSQLQRLIPRMINQLGIIQNSQHQ